MFEGEEEVSREREKEEMTLIEKIKQLLLSFQRYPAAQPPPPPPPPDAELPAEVAPPPPSADEKQTASPRKTVTDAQAIAFLLAAVICVVGALVGLYFLLAVIINNIPTELGQLGFVFFVMLLIVFCCCLII